MKILVMATVREVRQKEDYPLKPNGETDYRAKKVQYFESELHLLDNKLGVHGVISVREKLDFGVIHEIIIDTAPLLQTAEIQEVSETAKSVE